MSIEILTVSVTLLVALATIVYNVLSAKNDRVNQHIIASRLEQINKRLTCYTEVIYLLSPNMLRVQLKQKESTYVKELSAAFFQFSILLDQRFESDTELIRLIERLYVVAMNCVFCEETCSTYEDLYAEVFPLINMSASVFSKSEWTRLKKEVKKGKDIGTKEWSSIYDDSQNWFYKWQRNLSTVYPNSIFNVPNKNEITEQKTKNNKTNIKNL